MIITVLLANVYTLLILFYPIISQYLSPICNLQAGLLSLVFLFFIIFIFSINFKRIVLLKYQKKFLIYTFYILIIGMILFIFEVNISFFIFLKRTLFYILHFFLAVFITGRYFNTPLFMKYYKKIVWFAISFLFIQITVYKFRNTVILGTIPGLSFSNAAYSDTVMLETYTYFYRPSSIFLEPGYFAQYVLPYFVYLLFVEYLKTENIKKTLLKIFIVWASLFFTTSGQAIIISVILIFIWIGYQIFTSKKRKYFLSSLLILLFVIFLFSIIQDVPMVSKSLSRLFGSDVSSSESRIFYGFKIFKQLPLPLKFTGVGFGNIGNYILNNNIYVLSNGEVVQWEYMNSLAYILNNLGFIGALFMVQIFYDLWLHVPLYNKVILILFFLLGGVSALMVSGISIFYLSILIDGYSVKEDDLFEKKNFNHGR